MLHGICKMLVESLFLSLSWMSTLCLSILVFCQPLQLHCRWPYLDRRCFTGALLFKFWEVAMTVWFRRLTHVLS